jgi:hypothetical protein
MTTKLDAWESRLLDETVFPLTHSSVIYGDVLCFFNWKNGQIFGVEIYNKEIADAQRLLFNLLWEKSTPSQKN